MGEVGSHLLWEVEPQQASWILTKILKAKKYLEGTGVRMTEMSQLKTFFYKKNVPEDER